jgi:hypothetical protein
MRDVAVIGVGMTRFGKFLDKGIKDLVRESVEDALDDSGVGKEALQAAYVGNAAAGLMTGQETSTSSKSTMRPLLRRSSAGSSLKSAQAKKRPGGSTGDGWRSTARRPRIPRAGS